jgi:hypothetical protein
MNKTCDDRDSAGGREGSVLPAAGEWLGWPSGREWAGGHRVGRDAGTYDGAENVDAVSDLLDNGSMIGGVDHAARRGSGKERFRTTQAREPGVIRRERTGLGRGGSRAGGSPARKDQQRDPVRTPRAGPRASNRAPPAPRDGANAAPRSRPSLPLVARGGSRILDCPAYRRRPGRPPRDHAVHRGDERMASGSVRGRQRAFSTA